MAAKPPTALDQARAAVVLDSIGPCGETIGAAWYDWLRQHGLSRANADRGLNLLAASGTIVLEASDSDVWAKRVKAAAK